MQNMDELLKNVFTDLVEEEYQNRPAEFPRHRFSLKFRAKMYRLIHRAGENSKTERKGSLLELYRPVQSKRRLVVLLALLLMLLGGTVAAAGSIIRWLHQVVLEQHEDHYEIYNPEPEVSQNISEASAERQDFRKYLLTEVPEGYTLLKKEYKQIYELYRETYENSDKNMLLFKQCGVNEGHIGNVTSAEELLEEIAINGFTGYYIQDDDTGNLILSDGETLVELSGRMSKEELMHLAEKLKPIE